MLTDRIHPNVKLNNEVFGPHILAASQYMMEWQIGNNPRCHSTNKAKNSK